MPSFESFYPEYPCSYNSPLSCDRPFQTAQQIKGAKFCLECGFPATLPQDAEIKGSQGTYKIGSFIGVRGLGRLYSGIQLKDKQPVIIKEYLLPNRSFNESETLKRKETFKRVGGISLADSRIQNFRLVETKEAIADEKGERCYLITQGIESSQTLGKYLIEKGAMTSPDVREVLNQGLQTLQFLHTQKLRFPSNQTQLGITHGNINLDSTLIKIENNQNFSIYFCDLATWENLFIPPIIPQPAPARPDQDLESLGLLAFYLWVGRTTNFSSNQPLDPRDNQQWPDTDSHLKQFIYRLMGLETPFENAEMARQALLQLPKEDDGKSSVRSTASQVIEKRLPLPLILIGILALLLIGGGILYWVFGKKTDDHNQYILWSKLVRNFSEVSNVPSGEFTYTGEKDSTWSYVLTQPVDNSRLGELLTRPKLDATATFNYKSVLSLNVNNPSKSIEEVQTNKKDFAITSLEDNITDKLVKKPVAYDGLIVFVAFNKRDSNLANALGGQINLEQLRQIYTGKITNWQQISPKLPNLPVKPFAPTEPEAISKFQEIVLKNVPQDEALFAANVTKLDTTKTQNLIRSETLEGRSTGIISFGIISKTSSQCTGYPLAIADGKKSAIQPLFQRRDRRSINPSDDLCQHDDYYVDVTTFQSYPLGYPVFVVYPKDTSRLPGGSTFAQMLTTRQGQCLLSKVGLVALQPMPDDINSYACKSVP
ncbi:MAG: substrate-binding domain-containing protein [Nostoc sp. DedVER02]|uniref:substrate-binding domain-containing protein n=1 Tax=unclassified Nostoc TaxID=2593658 RepID=UPI002AD484CF|nr:MULTISPECIES: substrate-binding domain-containing protein [unclassified Nostoc]MDZ7985523.1 substrate-binding domain-containing protein [Nostoc sp. DedVER02]MDZ8116989.1 substrate-binding domain-containing protein [Nostoc sp. DedVER01b]